ncbi:uncharacterized protein LOC123683995 isoform X1 [Harmonia axyridis]|uniref:uncharacterized protein LOC123683995 isoform X1 n=2 Tax=Harmonia axyridis TaxID=115357 RepID=UPI001E277CA7|nr:uncharacterized protein LOC123683995 isoform X1 [Harmonia axyridis]XP_045478995.1 uncharacterized protein LOC123683995 isoform X1 [Harmonia axyridis]
MALSRVIFSPLWSSASGHLTANIKNTFMAFSKRSFSRLELTKNLALISRDQINSKVTNLKLHDQTGRPCVLLLSWLMAKRKHMMKFVDYYLNKDCDVLCINVTPWQLLWPTKGTQIVAADILRFLDSNYVNGQCLLHGFSVGAYLWAEVMVQMAAQQDRYKPVIDKFVGQVWDSAADVTEISVGLPVAVFPKNYVMQKALSQYIQYHMRTFNKVATRHYIRASQMFHTNLIKCPAQIFISKTDPIGAEASNMRVKESWENMGVKVYFKCWEKSPHVGHYQKHREEYLGHLDKFLEDIKFGVSASERLKAKL